jgi:hypothetical protein
MNEEVREDARATAEQVVQEAAQLIELEIKQMDPALDANEAEKLAQDSETLGHDIARTTTIQKRLFQLANQN